MGWWRKSSLYAKRVKFQETMLRPTRAVRGPDQSSDVWAFGCVLYEMLTGRQPFTAETITDQIEILNQALTRGFDSPETPSRRRLRSTSRGIAPIKTPPHSTEVPAPSRNETVSVLSKVPIRIRTLDTKFDQSSSSRLLGSTSFGSSACFALRTFN